MLEEIKMGDMAKDICGDVGEVIDIEYYEDEDDEEYGSVYRYILMEYDEENGCVKAQWPAHPDYTMKRN